MATRHNLGGGQPLPFALISQAIARLSRHDLEALTESLIDRLDALDPDPDNEPNGDELDGTSAEDDYLSTWESYPMPGCPISDPAEIGDHEAES